MNDFATQRERMVREQIMERGIEDTAVLRAMRSVPREQFVLDEYRDYAYEDSPLPIPAHQTISQPYVVAYMLEALDLQPTDRVLEIGAGSGYVAALLSHMVAEVHTVERHERLVRYARERLVALGYDNVWVHHGDGSLGWLPAAPYDGIVVAAGGPIVPPTLKQQMKVHGRLVMPVGKRGSQTLVRLERLSTEEYQHLNLGPVKFVPLVGEEGWGKG